LHSLKVAVKIVIGFLFSITIIVSFITTSLFGLRASDTIRLIVTEATGLRRDMVVFQGDLQPLVIHNIFWVCLASLGFMLIFLYFIDHSFKSLLGPGVLCVAITILLVVMLAIFHDNIYSFIGLVTEIYIKTAIDRFSRTAIGVVILGLLLVAASLWGDRLFKKARK
jgi:hypothetical protein